MLEKKYHRLLWHSRRSSLELDIILSRYIKDYYASLPVNLRNDYQKLLELDDIKLRQWLVERQPPDPPFQRIVTDILKSC